MKQKIKTALSIAGSDPCGGAGIQADLKTFQACRVYGMAVVTAITVQNTTGVRRAVCLEPSLVAEQIDALLDDIRPDAIKTGMLGSSEIMRVVAETLSNHDVQYLVVDPVIYASDSTPLLLDENIDSFKKHLFPIATIITPNMHEASLLTGINVHDLETMIRAAEMLHTLGARYVIVTGGHLPANEQAVDVLYDGDGHHLMPGERLPEGEQAHGSGCVFSAALTAYLARGAHIIDATEQAKRFVFKTLQSAIHIGHGKPNTNTLF